MLKTIDEHDFLFPKNDLTYSTTEIKGTLYYYAICPYNNNRLYGKTKEDLKSKIEETTELFRSYYNSKTTLKEALLTWITYFKYDSPKKKDKLRRLVDSIDKLLFQQSDIMHKVYTKTTAADIQIVVDTAIQNFDEKISYSFYQNMLLFIEFLNWLGVKVDSDIIYREKQSVPKTESNIVITTKELKLFDDEVTLINQINDDHKRYTDGAIVPLITLHTGIYSKTAFELKWSQIDFDKKVIKIGSIEYELDSFLYDTLKKYYTFKGIKGSPDTYLFKISDNPKRNNVNYENVLSTYRRIRKNCLITKELSLRDLQLIKGKQMLDSGMSKEEVCKRLDIAYGKVLWNRLIRYTIIEGDIDYNVDYIFSDGDREFLIEIKKETKDWSPDLCDRLLQYAKFLSNNK